MEITPFLNEEGSIKQWPARRVMQRAVLSYLAKKFEAERDYTEKEVNRLCEEWHTFGDYFLLRRGLVDEGFLNRETNGSRYWKPAIEEE